MRTEKKLQRHRMGKVKHHHNIQCLHSSLWVCRPSVIWKQAKSFQEYKMPTTQQKFGIPKHGMTTTWWCLKFGSFDYQSSTLPMRSCSPNLQKIDQHIPEKGHHWHISDTPKKETGKNPRTETKWRHHGASKCFPKPNVWRSFPFDKNCATGGETKEVCINNLCSKTPSKTRFNESLRLSCKLTLWKINGWNLKITCLKREIIWTKPPSIFGFQPWIFQKFAHQLSPKTRCVLKTAASIPQI